MPSAFAQKKLRVYDAQPVGAVVQSPINLETATNGQWIALDGRDVIRNAYPELSPYFPAGVFTGTNRSLNGAPVVTAIAADTTNFLAANPAGTTPIQASSNGVSWVTDGGATWAAATSPASIIVAGTRYVMAGSGGDLTQPYVSNTGQTAANQCVKANWTVTSGGATPITTLIQGLAYGSTANAGSGRTVLCRDPSLATASGLFYMDDGATAWNACSGGSTATRAGICWTGQKFFVLTSTQNAQISSDGATFSDTQVPYAYGTRIASDGNGTIVITLNTANCGAVLVSKDHGASWRKSFLPTEVPVPTDSFARLNYVNNKFIYTTNSGNAFMSSDGLSWVVEPYENRAAFTGNNRRSIAYKAGVYVGIETGANATSWTEDLSKFRVIAAVRTATDLMLNGAISNTYIKARSN